METILGLLAVLLLASIYGGIPLLLLYLVPPARARVSDRGERDDMYGGIGSRSQHHHVTYEAPASSDSYETFSDADYDTSAAGE